MKTKTFLLLASLLMSVSLFSQSFTLNYHQNVIDGWESTSSVLKADDGSLFIAVNSQACDNCKIMKMTEKGEIIDSEYIDIRNNGEHVGYNPFFTHPYLSNTNVYVYLSFNAQIPIFNAVFFDNDLNVIEEISTPLHSNEDFVNKGYFSSMLDNENNIVIQLGDGVDNEFMFVKLDLYGNILNEKMVYIETENPIDAIPIYSLCVYNQNPLQYGFTFSTIKNNGHNEECVAVLDDKFNLVEFNEGLVQSSTPPTSKNNIASLEDGSYLISSVTWSYKQGNAYRGIKLSKFNKNHELIKAYDVEQGTVNYYPYAPELSVRNIVTTENGDIYWLYFKEGIDSKGIGNLYVSYFDSDLNLQWEQKICQVYRTNCAYICNTIILENDNLLFSMNELVIGDDNNVVTVILENNNNLLNIEENNSVIRPYSFYPNPASDMINLSFSPDVKAEKIEIYGIDGKLYHEQNFNLETINIDNLSNGVYMMKVQLTNGNTYTDKIVVR